MPLSELLHVTEYSIETAGVSRVFLLGASVLLRSYPNLQLLFNSIQLSSIINLFSS